MKRGTTYPFIITIKDVDLTDVLWLIVSLKSSDSVILPNRSNILEFTLDDLNVTYDEGKTRIVFQLTEAQSLSLASRKVTVDVNWMQSNGMRGGVLPVEIDITNTLLTREVNM